MAEGVVILKKVKKVIRGISTVFGMLSAIIIALMMFLTVADVFGRRFLNSPVTGAFEVTRIFLVIAVFAGLGLAQMDGENLGITLLYDKLNRKLQSILDFVISIISIGLFYIIFTNTIKYANRIAASNQVTSVLRLPVHPWIIIGAVGVAVLILALIWDVIESVLKFKGEITDES